ncbi:MAG: WecB/TagA/CpsF family glycosyltransferase [Woeseia sp.]
MTTQTADKQESALQLNTGNPAGAAEGSAARDRLVSLLGLKVRDESVSEAADTLIARALARERLQCYFVNAHCVNVAARDPAYAEILQRAPFVFADGVGMAIAGRLLGRPLANNVNGTDLLPELCRRAAVRGIPMALLGARPGTAIACASRLRVLYPGLNIRWVRHGFLSEDEETKQLPGLNASGARILLVAKGVPHQEKWIDRFAPHLDVPVIIGVGALFDFYSGSIPRAPMMVRRMRMEWAYRLLREPRRLAGRYLKGNPEFLARVIRARVGGTAFPAARHPETASQEHD